MSETSPEYEFDLATLTADIPAEIKELHVLPRDFNRGTVGKAFHETFELIGGVPRLAIWAHANQTEFYKLYSRLMPNAATQDFDLGNKQTRVVHVLPRTSLDGDVTEAEFEEVGEEHGRNLEDNP